MIYKSPINSPFHYQSSVMWPRRRLSRALLGMSPGFCRFNFLTSRILLVLALGLSFLLQVLRIARIMRIFKLARRSIGLQVFTQDLNIFHLGAHFFTYAFIKGWILNTSLHFQLNSADFLTSDICPSFQRVHRHHNHVTLELRQSLTQWSAVTKNLGCFSCLLGWECSFLEGEQNLSK